MVFSSPKAPTQREEREAQLALYRWPQMGVLNIYERSSFHSSRVVSGDIKGNRKRNPRISRFAKEIMYQSQSDSSMYKRGILVNSLSAEEIPLSSIYSCHMEDTKRCLKQRTWHISSRAWGTEAKSLTLDFCFPSSASSVASVQLPLSLCLSSEGQQTWVI